MIRVLVISLFIVSAFLGCKSSKTSKYISPHTDTIKVTVSYSQDSIELYVKKIIENDSLFKIKESAPTYTIVDAQQKDSLLYVTVKGFNGCSTADFDLYQSSLVFKSYPPRIRMRLAKQSEGDCESENANVVRFYTEVFDIRGILKQYDKANISFKNSRTVVLLEK